MKWQDIIKNVITQSRVKEIEDIDIDIEEDDCLRWLEKLYDIIARHPESEVHKNQVQDEESACAIKEAWERKGNSSINPNPMFTQSNLPKLNTTNGYLSYTEKATVHFSLADIGTGENLQDGIMVTLYSLYHHRGRLVSKVMILITNKEKASKTTKEICNYLNISYDKMARGIL